MEILKRAKGENDGEIVDWNESEANVREEVNRRTCKAGYTNREGGPPASGKGDSYRPVNKKKYDEVHERVFGKKKLNIWPRDSEGNLIDD